MGTKGKTKKVVKSEKTELGSFEGDHARTFEGAGEQVVVPVLEEYLKVGKRQVIAGKVTLHKTVAERLETVTIPLQRETIAVKRVAVGEILSQPSQARQEGDTLIIPVFEEVLVTEKRFRLVEEIHLTTVRTEHDEMQEFMLRQEKVRLERDGKEISLDELESSR